MADNRQALRQEITDAAVAPGLIAYVDARPVGWTGLGAALDSAADEALALSWRLKGPCRPQHPARQATHGRAQSKWRPRRRGGVMASNELAGRFRPSQASARSLAGAHTP